MPTPEDIAHERNFLEVYRRMLCRLLHQAVQYRERGTVELERLLHDRRVLLVLDDVWRAVDAEPLLISAPGCGVLLTTRDVAQVHGATLVPLAEMVRTESRELLRAAARGVALDDTLADMIAARVHGLPLALQVVGALLASGLRWQDMVEALVADELAFLAHGQRSVLAAIQTSVAARPPAQAARYHALAIFARGPGWPMGGRVRRRPAPCPRTGRCAARGGAVRGRAVPHGGGATARVERRPVGGVVAARRGWSAGRAVGNLRARRAYTRCCSIACVGCGG